MNTESELSRFLPWNHPLRQEVSELVKQYHTYAQSHLPSESTRHLENEIVNLLTSKLCPLMSIAVAANSDAPIPNRLDDIEKAITAAQEKGIEIK